MTHQFVRWGDAILIEDVMINGKGPFRFILDTGAEGAGRVDAILVGELSLPEAGHVRSSGIFGQKDAVSLRHVDSLSIGALSFSNLRLLSRDYNADRPAGLRPIHGILGYHLFNEYLLTINYPARTISVIPGELPPPDGKHVLAIISDDEDPEIEVTVGDQVTRALIDSGALNTLAVPAALAEKLKFTSEPRIRGWEGRVGVRSGTLEGALRIGAMEVTNPETLVAGPLKETNIGARILADFAVTFDQKNARVRFERPPPRKRYGIKFSMPRSGTPKYDGVVAGGVAELAGLRAEDRLIAMNGRPLPEIDREDLVRLLDTSPLTLGIEREGDRIELRLSLD